jgi:RNA polymerase subunit RPABC4/transcription elongation factor Spt4
MRRPPFPSSAADVGFGILLLPETSTIAEQVRAEFKVPYAKLKGLKADDFFETKIAPGSHAPEHHDARFADDGCTSETFQWNGAVLILRES